MKNNRKPQHVINQEIEALVAERGLDKNNYDPLEYELLQHYKGAGGQAGQGATGKGLLYEFYTPSYLVKLVWELAIHYGFEQSGHMLEPACGTGRFFEGAPPGLKITGFEPNETAGQIAQIMYPKSTIHYKPFETAFLEKPRHTTRISGTGTWLKGYPFSIVVGNPPFGKYQNYYSSYFPNPKVLQTEFFFIYYGLQLLASGGLLVYIIPSNFLRNGLTYNAIKAKMGKLCTLVDAYRLPSVFSKTNVPVDIILLRRK